MGKLHTFWNVFRRHKYGFVIGLFVLLMGSGRRKQFVEPLSS